MSAPWGHWDEGLGRRARLHAPIRSHGTGHALTSGEGNQAAFDLVGARYRIARGNARHTCGATPMVAPDGQGRIIGGFGRGLRPRRRLNMDPEQSTGSSRVRSAARGRESRPQKARVLGRGATVTALSTRARASQEGVHLGVAATRDSGGELSGQRGLESDAALRWRVGIRVGGGMP